MTLCIAAQSKDRFIVASDSMTSEPHRSDWLTRKLYRFGDVVISASGGLRFIQSAVHRLPRDPSVEDLARVVSEKRAEEDDRSDFMYCSSRGVYLIDSLGGVCRPAQPYTAIGQGDLLAIGMLWPLYRRGLPNHGTLRRRMAHALDLARQMVPGVGPPWQWESVRWP